MQCCVGIVAHATANIAVDSASMVDFFNQLLLSGFGADSHIIY